MAYGSTKSISDSILSATDGESIQEQIDVYMQSTASGTTGDGLIAAATINKDTDAAVTAMRRKSLGARKSQATAQNAVTKDKLASVGRDWTALLMGNEEEDATINATLRSDMMAEEARKAPQTANEAYLQRRELPTDGDRPDVLTPDGSDNISGSGASIAEGRFGDTGAFGMMSSLRPKARGLTDDDMGLPNDDNYMGVIADTPEQNLLDRIAFGEGAEPKKLKRQDKHGIGTTPYHMVYDYGNTVAPPKPITEMTLSELEVYQIDLINATKGTLPGTKEGTSAVGKYQVLRRSLFGAGGSAANPKAKSWAGKLGLTADTVYTPAVQEAIGRLALKETGYDNWKKGEKSESAMLQRVADIWASVEGSTAGQGIHTTKKDLEPFLSLVRPISPQAPKRSLRPQARP
jgi:hypothetical protein